MPGYLDRIKRLSQQTAHPGSQDEKSVDCAKSVISAKSLPRREYQRAYPGDTIGDVELAEIVRRVEAEGYVLCYADVLADYVAFVRDGINTSTIPRDFTIYTETELMHLFGKDKPDLSPDALRRIHQAKKLRTRIVDNQPEDKAKGL